MAIPRPWFIAGGVAGAVVVVTAIIVVAVVLSGGSNAPYTLESSRPGTFYVAESTSDSLSDGSPRIVARSYDGHPWERAPGSAGVGIACSGSSCAITTPGSYRTRSIPVPDTTGLPNIAEQASWYSQGGFGASLSTLRATLSTYGNNIGLWIRAQMNLPASLTREHYRKRTNPRPEDIATLRHPATSPCSVGSRWTPTLFQQSDRYRSITVLANTSGQFYEIRVNNALRAQLTSFFGQPFPNASNMTDIPIAYVICSNVEEVINGSIVMARAADGVCGSGTSIPAGRFSFPMPRLGMIDLSQLNRESVPYQDFASGTLTLAPVVGGLGAMVVRAFGAPCTLANLGSGAAFITYQGQLYRFDRRLVYHANTLDAPSASGPAGNGVCPIALPSYQSVGNCTVVDMCVLPPQFNSRTIPLDNVTLRAWVTDTPDHPRYVYALGGLRLDFPEDIGPCENTVTRWQKLVNGPCVLPETTLDATTATAIRNALNATTDKLNPMFRDVSVGLSCTRGTAPGVIIFADNACWQQVHPNYFNVYDASDWVNLHDGNAVVMATGAPNPIKRFADLGLTILSFPASHPMERWLQRNRFFIFVGRFGDNVSFTNLPSQLRTVEMARRYGALRDVPPGGVLACGSVGESENDPSLGNHYLTYSTLDGNSLNNLPEFPMSRGENVPSVVVNVQMSAPDQLRQRVAWALSNFIVSSQTDDFLTDRPEGHLQFYDIFVRHAFGNYEDVLTDVSYNPVMSQYLTFLGSRAFAVSNNLADENYAREIMQLFSIGLNKRNKDGTLMLDASGQSIATYTNEDIIDYARAWTGFVQAPFRVNFFDYISSNQVDPLRIQAQNRDRFPKPLLDGVGYLGDGYPICDELPVKPWLRAGATFEFIGPISNEGEDMDRGLGRFGRFAPSEADGSQLFAALCARPSTNQPCRFPTVVTLPSTISPVGRAERDAEIVFSVAVYDRVSNQTFYYRLRNEPCVRMTFFTNGRVVQSVRSECANPLNARAQPTCCNPASPTSNGPASNECAFTNEHMTYATALARCNAQGQILCTRNLGGTWGNTSRLCSLEAPGWINRTCTHQIQVHGNGRIGIYDPLSRDSIVGLSTNNVFRVFWNNGGFPRAVSGQCPSPCSVAVTLQGDTCLCNFTVTSSTVYDSTSSIGTSLAALEAALSRGAWPIAEYPAGTYVEATEQPLRDQGVVIWVTAASRAIDDKAIFQLPPKRTGFPMRYFANIRETVQLGSFSFRNPPAFMPLLGYTYVSSRPHLAYDLLGNEAAHWETKALIRHLVQHDNTAPYVCIGLMKNMITSNPPPRYVRACVDAFSTGAVGSERFSGKYGDLGAAVYAILTDREARSRSVQADPQQGLVHDPLVLILRTLRSLDYVSQYGRQTVLSSLPVLPLTAPNVFNFFDDEFAPDSRWQEMGLVAPQLELMTPANIIGLLNGLHNLIENGLTRCGNDGFGSTLLRPNTGRDCPTLQRRRNSADGHLTYLPASISVAADEVIGELSTLLTAGRVLPGSLTWRRAVSRFQALSYGINTTAQLANAVQEALRVITSSPEFFSSAIYKETSTPRVLEPPSRSANLPLRSIFLHQFEGGADTWNMLIPFADCPVKDMFAELDTVRAGGLLPRGRFRPITVPSGTQPCNTFALHDMLPNLRDMYNAGEVIFFANVGSLIEPVTAEQVRRNSRRLPPSLFSHNTMSRSTKTLDPTNIAAFGLLGRARDALAQQQNPMEVLMASFGGKTITMRGTSPYEVLSSSGVVLLNVNNESRATIDGFVAKETDNLIANEFVAVVGSGISSARRVQDIINSGTLMVDGFGTTGTSRNARLASRLNSWAKTNTTDRTAYFSASGGFDTHNTFNIDNLLTPFDNAIFEFRREMIAQGLWNDTVIIVSSEFARTLRSNGAGSDHAWGGHFFIIGGGVRGGRILGEYPNVLTDGGSHVLSGGRIVPTMPLEGMWKGILEWYGVQEPALSTRVLPNLRNFPSSRTYSRSDLFRN